MHNDLIFVLHHLWLLLGPVYSATWIPTCLGASGESTQLVTAADGTGTLGTGNYSRVVNITDYIAGFPRPVLIGFNYASVPSSTEYDIYVSQTNTDPRVSPSTWTNIGKTTNTAGDQVTLQRGAAGGNQFNFLCVKEVTSPGVLTSVTVSM